MGLDTIQRCSGGADGSEPRVCMIVVDAMSLDFARAHLDDLPNLARMLGNGAARELSSTAVHMSAGVWPSFAAGVDPGVTGHYYPFQWSPADMRFKRTYKRSWIDEFHFDPFWYRLAEGGVATVAFDAGVALDPAHAPCAEISNWSYQSSGHATSTDPALLAELHRRFGRRPIGKEVPVPKTFGQCRRLRDSMVDALSRKTDALFWLMDRFDWRFFLVGYYELHRAGHNLLVVDGEFGSKADPDALLEVYRAQDRALGRILEKVGDARTTVVLAALHGMAPNWAQDHFLDEILARLNAAWLSSRGESVRSPTGRGLIAQLRARVPYGLQYALAEILGEDVQDFVVNRTILGGLRWPRTPVIRMASGGEAFLRFNIKGRERDGYFAADGADLAVYREWLRERLGEIKVVATGEALFGDIVDAHRLYPGARTDRLPDLILKYRPQEPAVAIHSPTIGEIRAHLETGRGGNHVGDAFIIADGPGARRPSFSDLGDIKDIGRFIEDALRGADASREAAPAALSA